MSQPSKDCKKIEIKAVNENMINTKYEKIIVYQNILRSIIITEIHYF